MMRLAKRKMTAEQAFQKVLVSVTGQMSEPSAEADKIEKETRLVEFERPLDRFILSPSTLHQFVVCFVLTDSLADVAPHVI